MSINGKRGKYIVVDPSVDYYSEIQHGDVLFRSPLRKGRLISPPSGGATGRQRSAASSFSGGIFLAEMYNPAPNTIFFLEKQPTVNAQSTWVGRTCQSLRLLWMNTQLQSAHEQASTYPWTTHVSMVAITGSSSWDQLRLVWGLPHSFISSSILLYPLPSKAVDPKRPPYSMPCMLIFVSFQAIQPVRNYW